MLKRWGDLRIIPNSPRQRAEAIGYEIIRTVGATCEVSYIECKWYEDNFPSDDGILYITFRSEWSKYHAEIRYASDTDKIAVSERRQSYEGDLRTQHIQLADPNLFDKIAYLVVDWLFTPDCPI